MTKHFEELWNDAEKSSSAIFETKSNMEIYKELSNAIERIINYTEGLGSNYYENKIGALLYIISSLSEREKINVYTALNNTIKLKEKEKFFNEMIEDIDLKESIDPIC
jgi:hypothetical protein